MLCGGPFKYKFVGEIDQNGFAGGNGIATNAEGYTYEGSFIGDKFEGIGKYT